MTGCWWDGNYDKYDYNKDDYPSDNDKDKCDEPGVMDL